jgi:uncharacterized protein (TIGR03437 family)
MSLARYLAILTLGSLVAQGADPGAPQYTADSIANPVTAVAGMYAPNSFITIYGNHLSYVTRAMGPDDLRAGMLPTVLIGTSVRVLINHLPAAIYYVSPTQVNLLAPVSLLAGPATIQLINDGLAGPAINIMLDPIAPALFELNGTVVLAAHLDGTVITSDAPARRGEVVVVYATGLGPTVPAGTPNRLPDAAAPLARMADFQVWLNGVPVPATGILYAGISPPYAGLFQINLRVPDDAPADPEIRCGYPEEMSQAGGILPLR